MKKLVRRALLCIVFLLVLQLLVGVTTALADPGYHVVRPGETLFSIGRLYGVNPYTIASVNGLANPNYIQIGQLLYIPDGWYYPQPPGWGGYWRGYYWWHYPYHYYPYWWWGGYWWDP